MSICKFYYLYLTPLISVLPQEHSALLAKIAEGVEQYSAAMMEISKSISQHNDNYVVTVVKVREITK